MPLQKRDLYRKNNAFLSMLKDINQSVISNVGSVLEFRISLRTEIDPKAGKPIYVVV